MEKKRHYIEIGDIGNLKGVKVICCPREHSISCKNCAFLARPLEYCADISCNDIEREDKQNVIFKKLLQDE